jgi:hypothetical protein
MPVISTRGVASAKALGFLSGGTATTVSFFTTSSWTAPAGVTNVRAVLVGQPVIPAYWDYPLIGPRGEYTSSTPPTQASVDNGIAAWVANATPVFDVGAPGVRTISGAVGQTSWLLSNGDTTLIADNVTFYGPTYTIRGTFAGTTFYPAQINTSFKSFFAYNSSNGIEVYRDAQDGGATIMFGSSAAGGIAPSGSPTTIVLASQAVVPGTAYSVIVSSTYTSVFGNISGSVTLTYVTP